MATADINKPRVDAVLVGFGWTGAIMGWRLSDEEVAELLSFVRRSWGNHAAAVSSDEIGCVRKALLSK